MTNKPINFVVQRLGFLHFMFNQGRLFDHSFFSWNQAEINFFHALYMHMRFKEWLLNDGFATGAKLGLYPPIDDALGQYPPLYGIPRASDLVTYIDIAYSGKGPTSKDGIVKYHDKDPRITKGKRHGKVQPLRGQKQNVLQLSKQVWKPRLNGKPN